MKGETMTFKEIHDLINPGLEKFVQALQAIESRIIDKEKDSDHKLQKLAESSDKLALERKEQATQHSKAMEALAVKQLALDAKSKELQAAIAEHQGLTAKLSKDGALLTGRLMDAENLRLLAKAEADEQNKLTKQLEAKIASLKSDTDALDNRRRKLDDEASLIETKKKALAQEESKIAGMRDQAKEDLEKAQDYKKQYEAELKRLKNVK